METFVKATSDAGQPKEDGKPKKDGQPKEDGKPKEIGGYLRVSRVLFPPECQTPADRAHHIEYLRQIRRSELEADAARNGDRISAWYDDIGMSGRGEL